MAAIDRLETKPPTYLLGLVICAHANGRVGGQLLDAVGQLGAYALERTGVCLVAGVTGIHLNRGEPQLSEGHECTFR